MSRILAAVSLAAAVGVAATTRAGASDDNRSWHLKASVIQACSCPMVCPCYFSTEPAAHIESDGHAERYCRANQAFHVHKGSFGKTRLDDVEFWVAWDVGDSYADGKMKWAVIHFDPDVAKDQRDGIVAILAHLYPYRWETPITIGDDMEIDWDKSGDKAVARLDGGRAGEVTLDGAAMRRTKTGQTEIENLRYWAAPRNDGFVLMKAETDAYRVGPNAFEYKATNGFMVTFDMSSKDEIAASSGGH